MNNSASPRVVTFEPQYAEAFKRLNLEWIKKHFKVEAKDLEQVDNPQQCLSQGGQIFILLKGLEVAGTCALYKVEAHTFELAKMAVDIRFRGLGYGDLLMNAAEGWALGQGAHEILILSNTVLEPAINLYKKHAYQVTHLGPHPDYERCNIELRKPMSQ